MTSEENDGDVSTPEKGEDWNKWLIEETERFESEKRQLESDISRMKRENAHLKGELARLRAPPQVIGTVTDCLEDGRVSIKSSSGPDFVVHISEGINKENLDVGDRVALHRQTLAVLETPPSTKDPLVMGAEVDSKPSENYNDIGGLVEEVDELRSTVELPMLHPKRFSNTFLFYKKGWHGINIDPMPGSMKIFKKIRPRDTNLEIAVSHKEQELTYYMFNEPALNSFSKTIAIQHQNEHYNIKKVIKVPSLPLSEILANHLPKRQIIDVLNVDVEGLDLEVLKSNDWQNYRPKIILVEILHSSLNAINSEPIYKFLGKMGYSLVSKLFHTCIFEFFINHLSRPIFDIFYGKIYSRNIVKYYLCNINLQLCPICSCRSFGTRYWNFFG